jgi:hypothetical protein
VSGTFLDPAVVAGRELVGRLCVGPITCAPIAVAEFCVVTNPTVAAGRPEAVDDGAAALG